MSECRILKVVRRRFAVTFNTLCFHKFFIAAFVPRRTNVILLSRQFESGKEEKKVAAKESPLEENEGLHIYQGKIR